MYEYYDQNQNQNQDNENEQKINQALINEQIKARKKAEKKAASSRFWKKIGTGLCIGIVFGVGAGCCFSAVTRIVDRFLPRTVIEQKSDRDIEDRQPEKREIGVTETRDKRDDGDRRDYSKANASIGMGVSELVKESMPSIVSITNKSVQEVRSMFGMGVREYESTSAGSGIIIGQSDDELLIATNNHVIAGANTLTVGFVDDEVYTAYVKGQDADIDLAVVAVKLNDISDSTLEKIKVAVIGDSDALEVGEQVVAIGNALGYGQSVTTGIVSAVNRDITDDDVENPLIQTDAAINPGNSGGALFNMQGELVGINSAKIASTSIEGVGYAIPMSAAKPVIETLMNRQTREEVDAKDAGYIGISGVSVDSNTSEMYGIPQGIYIQTVEEDSPAEKAGLQKSDVLRKFDGITVSSIQEVRENLNYYKAGETVELVIYRQIDGEYVEKTLSITLGSRSGTALDPKNNDKSEAPDDEEEAEEPEEDDSIYFDYGSDIEDFFNFFPY